MMKKLEKSEKQKAEIKNLKKEKRELTKKLEDSERQKVDLEELLQIKTDQHQSSLNEHTEQMERQCRLAEALTKSNRTSSGVFQGIWRYVLS